MYLTYVCKSLGLLEKIITSSANINRNKLIPCIFYVGQFFLTKLISKTLTYGFLLIPIFFDQAVDHLLSVNNVNYFL